jgi:hypothetical protein
MNTKMLQYSYSYLSASPNYQMEARKPRPPLARWISDNCPIESSAEEDGSEWDFILPSIPPPSYLTPGIAFSLPDIVGAMQHGASLETVQDYLGYYDQNIVRENVNGEVDGFPAMFFVVATNNPAILRTWVAYGGDVDVITIYKGSIIESSPSGICHNSE